MSEDFSSGEDFLSTIQENLATILIEKFNEIDLDSIDWVRLAKIVGGYFLTGNRQIKGVGNLIPDNMLISFRNRFRKEVSDSRALDLQKKKSYRYQKSALCHNYVVLLLEILNCGQHIICREWDMKT